MADQEPDYAKLSIEELLAEEKKIKKNEIFSAGFIGLLIGIMIYGVSQNSSGYIYILIPLLLIYGVYKQSQRLKDQLNQIQAEIKLRNTESDR